MNALAGYHFVEKECGSKLHVSLSGWLDCEGTGSVFYLNGYHSDFTSPMKRAMREHCERHQINFVSLEYSGHGKSDGNRDVGLSNFLDDARFVYQKYCESQNEPTTIVGHSIGGWLGIVLAQEAEARKPQSIAGVVSVAPTFSLTGPNGFVTRLLSRPVNAKKFEAQGFIASPLGRDTGMIYTKDFIEDARKLDLVHKPNGELLEPLLPLNFGITCLYGADDVAAPQDDFDLFARRLPEGAVKIVRRETEKDPQDPAKTRPANHALDRPTDLRLLKREVDNYIARGKCMISGATLPRPGL